MYKRILGFFLLYFLIDYFFQNVSFGNNLFLHLNKDKDRKYFFLNDEEEKVLEEIKIQIKKEEWFEAFRLEKKIEDTGFKKAVNTYITLKKFQSLKSYTLQEIQGLMEFNLDNKFLSSFNKIQSTIENLYLDDFLKYEDVKSYFKKAPSKNIVVSTKLFQDEEEYIKNSNITENEKNKNLNNLKTKINNFWVYNISNYDSETIFYQNFGDKIIDSLTILKIKYLIFKKKDFISEIRFLKDENYKQFFRIILNIISTTGNIDFLLKQVPKDLKDDETLLFAKTIYYRKIKEDDKVIKILTELKGEEIFANYWWIYRHIYSRNLLTEKKYKHAYQIASGFNGKNSTEYAESNWLSGWIAFNFLKDNVIALKHFQKYYKYVMYPTSLSDGAYWIARIYESTNLNQEALKWYEISSKYSTTFYGQLSHYAKYNILSANGEEYKEIVFPEPQEATEEEKNNLDENRVVKLGVLYYKYLDQKDEGFNILKYSIQENLKNRGEISELIEMLEKFNEESLIIPLAKLASHKMVFFLKHLFPTLRMIKKEEKELALVHAIIKQESGFVVKAQSSVGAIGFMQIMPATAKQLCQDLKITYNNYKLQHDPQYNIFLGKFYIKTLLKQYKDSKVLAIAAYNAGPNNCKRWMKTYGDPRDEEIVENVVNWIEQVPFGETRNYIKRVLENLIVYDYLISNG